MKILLVDDEKAVKALFQQKFKKEIKDKLFEFEFAYSAEEAMEMLNKSHESDILLLSDINLPGLSGLQLAKMAKTIYPGMQIMVLTAYGDQTNYNAAIGNGVSEFFIKPINFDLLKEKLIKFKNKEYDIQPK